jgi:coenzyme F420-0:L-glutamate ligase / coenzyme F420-1:gamma-L-glutamate ligase
MIRLVPLPIAERIQPGDDLVALLAAAVVAAGEELQTGDVLVVAQKPISKAEGRIVDLADVEPSAEALSIAAEDDGDARVVEVILRESVEVVRRRGSFIIGRTTHGHVCGSAGVDRSNQNVPDQVTLLPVDPDESAQRLHDGLHAMTGAAVAIVISDSLPRSSSTLVASMMRVASCTPPVFTWLISLRVPPSWQWAPTAACRRRSFAASSSSLALRVQQRV